MKKILSLLVIVSLSLFVIAWCANKNGVKVGDQVSITYTATFPDGKVFEQNTDQTPLLFTIGSGQVIQGLNDGIVGMNVGKTKIITIKPEQWYGSMYDTNKVQKVPQFVFDKLNIKPDIWTMQKLGDIEGIVKWTEKDEEGNVLVLFDINPRQTRDTLQYKVTVLTKN